MSKLSSLLSKIDSFYKLAMKLDISSPSFIDPNLSDQDDYLEKDFSPSLNIIDNKPTLSSTLKSSAEELLNISSLAWKEIQNTLKQVSYLKDMKSISKIRFLAEELSMFNKIMNIIIESDNVKPMPLAVLKKLDGLVDKFYEASEDMNLEVLNHLSNRLMFMITLLSTRTQLPGQHFEK